MMRHTIRLATLAIALVVLVGCGVGTNRKPATVSGNVSLAGKGAVTGGNITFTPTSAPDKARTGAIKGDGTYSITDVARGECKVSVETASLKTMMAAPSMDMGGGTSGPAPKYMAIDAKYAKAETSGLNANVNADPFTFDVELK